MPSNLRSLEKGLRAVGFGPKVDEFILSMNRSAEAAAPQARKIFGDAILAMTFDDARKILSGGDTAATDYFKGKTTDQLTVAFQPIVEKTMNENGVTPQYKALTDRFASIPFAKNRSFDINKYVVTKALDGLFTNSPTKSAKFARTRPPEPHLCSKKCLESRAHNCQTAQTAIRFCFAGLLLAIYFDL